MAYVNVGALNSGGQRIPTKKALKEAVQRYNEGQQDAVVFDQTAMMQSGSVPGMATCNDLSEGIVLSVVGPDPYEKRNWYASVERKGDLVKVS